MSEWVIVACLGLGLILTDVLEAIWLDRALARVRDLEDALERAQADRDVPVVKYPKLMVPGHRGPRGFDSVVATGRPPSRHRGPEEVVDDEQQL